MVFGTFRKGIEVQGAGSTTTTLNVTGLSTAQGGIEFGASGVGGTITAAGSAEFAGIVTATRFKGDGSQLSGVGGDTDITSSLFI